jgi:signal transduction histidine kinase
MAAALFGDRLPRPARVAIQEVLLVGAAVGVILLSHPTGIPWAEPAALIAAVALPLRLRWPWLAMLLALVALSGELGLGPAAVAIYRIGRTSPSRLANLAWLAAAIIVPQLTIVYTQHLSWQDSALSVLFSVAWSLAPMAVGVLVRTRERLAHSLTELREAREAELTARTDQARAEERARIGQEIHDSVGHHATLIAVEAAALQAMAPDGETKQIAQRIRNQAKESLTEMRAALGLSTAPREAPTPDLSDLIAQVRHSGMRIDYADSPQDNLAPPVRRAVFRIVQESLTNAAKHAPGAAVTVRVTNDGPECVVVVSSGPSQRSQLDPWPTGGMGLTGMTERARTMGGDLVTARDPSGVFTVRARLPLQAVSTIESR